MKKLACLLLAVVMVLSLAPMAAAADAVESPEFEVSRLANLTYGEDYETLYDYAGKSTTIADVIEDPDTGLAYIEVDGELHELGMDFLSMAMVYNTDPAGDYETSDDVYAAWWRLYIQRWNYIMPEVPLYSNEYYDLYNAQIKGVEEHPTNPFWSPTRALIDWTSEKEDKSIIVGNTTELSGQFRVASFGKNSPGAADNDVQSLTTGLYTVTNTKEGGYVWDENVVKEHTEELDEEGKSTCNEETCVDCGACVATCPVEALSL